MQEQFDERQLAKESALKELHNQELSGMDDGPEYFQTRYTQEHELLQGAKAEMASLKVRFDAAKKRKNLIVEKLCNLRDEIEEAKSPIIKLSKTFDAKAWEQADAELLKTYGLAESIITMLKAGGFNTVGEIMRDESWQDIDGCGEATQEKVTTACADLVDDFNKRLAELEKMKAEKEAGEA